MSRKLVLPLLAAIALTVSGCDMFMAVTPENAKGVIHFYTIRNCGPCKVAKPVVKKLKEQGFKIREFDAGNSPTKAGKAGVHKFPTFIHYMDGKETKRIVGTASESELKRMFRP